MQRDQVDYFLSKEEILVGSPLTCMLSENDSEPHDIGIGIEYIVKVIIDDLDLDNDHIDVFDCTSILYPNRDKESG